ncbi:YciI family protein [Kribbella deserti]|uniref:YciI family protein n=1 Tax=Kribbella deserti TaxID=1926257 RepID=A0ABV6QLZ6_9ACTN
MKFLVLIYGNLETRKMWEGMPKEQKSAGLDYYAGLTKDLAASGRLVATAPLAEPAATKQVRVGPGGEVLSTDGPFAETKEHLAGFYVLDCDDLEQAIETAARIPEAQFGLVEVRPTRELNDLL